MAEDMTTCVKCGAERSTKTRMRLCDDHYREYQRTYTARQRRRKTEQHEVFERIYTRHGLIAGQVWQIALSARKGAA